jgi:hypothetical protein
MRKAQMLAFTVLLLAAADLAAVVDPDRKKTRTPNVDPVQQGLKQLEGKWDIAVSLSDLAVTIQGGIFTSADSKGNVRVAAVMKIDPAKKPK